MLRSIFAKVALVAIGLAAACAAEPARHESAKVTEAPIVAPLFPRTPQSFAPSQAEADGKIDGKMLADVDQCDGCHADAVAQWKTSAHAFASFNNPIYRVSVDRFRKEVGDQKSRFCAGCHDVALLVDGAIDGEIDPGDWRAHAGVTCVTCHSIRATRPDGNASYTLTSAPIPMPKANDPASVAAHRARLALPPLRDGIGVCASCHRAFADESTGSAAFFAGQDEVGVYSRSAYAGSEGERVDAPIARKDCRGCHMAREAATFADVSAKGGTIASHRFLGGHAWLASMRGDREQLARVTAMLKSAATIDVAVAIDEHDRRGLPAETLPIAPGERITLDVVVKNVGAGHRFPGGTLDSHDAFVTVEVADANGKKIASSGDDEGAHRLRALVVGDDATPRLERQVNQLRNAVANHTLLPRDGEVIEYAFTAPASLALPLRVTARLLDRTQNLAMQAAACASAKTERGVAFRGRTPLDPCPTQPVIEVAKSVVALGCGSTEASARPSWERLLDHGNAMMHAVQERLEECRPSLDRALELLGDGGAPRDRARVLAALGTLDAHEGRTADALALFDRASLAGGDAIAPTLASLRGDALASVWRWDEAVGPLAIAARAFPNDDGAWLRLATAESSRASDRAALDAVLRGLALAPRDADLLRVQAVSLAALHASDATIAEARDAYEATRPPDDIPALRSKCSRTVPGCATERLPVHEHAMR